jgi:hypothetical protein
MDEDMWSNGGIILTGEIDKDCDEPKLYILFVPRSKHTVSRL